jgi:hypothetical protein
MSNFQRPLNSSYRKARAEQAANQERQRIFRAEHRAKVAEWGPIAPYGLPAPAPEPVQQPQSKPDGDSPDDLKA